MNFSRLIALSSSPDVSEEQSLLRIERHLKKQNFQAKREEHAVRANLFDWKEVLSTTDADRLSWRSLDIEHQDSAIHLRLRYNWLFQAIAHFFLTVFVCTFVVRFGSRESVFPMLVSMNAALGVGSLVFARLYARKFAREIETALR